jgi:aspartate/methionine/tyrosine aminotransferase
MQVVQQLIRDFGVAVIPGDTFGIDGCYLRISYGALDKDSVDAGIGRLCEGLRAIAANHSP